MSLTAEYLWERSERDENFAIGAKKVETSYVPLGINFFHSSGLSVSLKGTYIDQEGTFERPFAGTFESGQDDPLFCLSHFRARLEADSRI